MKEKVSTKVQIDKLNISYINKVTMKKIGRLNPRSVSDKQTKVIPHEKCVFYSLAKIRDILNPMVFPKMFFRKRVKPCFFCVTFNIIVSHIFPENFIEISQFVQKI